MSNAPDPRLRYVGLITLIEQESDLKKKNILIEQGLNDPNRKIRAVSLKFITAQASSGVISGLAELMDEGDLSEIAYGSALLVQKAPIFEKHLELARSDDDNLAEKSINILMHANRAVAIPFLFKIIEEWDEYKDNFNKYGYTDEDVKERLIDLGKSYMILPKEIKQTVIEYCGSNNGVLQNTALKIMENKWAKIDLKIIDKIDTKQNPFAKHLKLKAMVEKESKSSLAKAKQYLNDPVELVRDTAIEALGEIGGKEELKELLNIHDEMIKTKDWRFNPGLIGEAVQKIKKRLKKK